MHFKRHPHRCHWYDIINHKHAHNRCRQHELTVSLSFQCTHRVQGLCVVNAWMMICQGVRTRFLVYDDEWATLALHTPCSLYLSCHFGSLQHNPASSNCKVGPGERKKTLSGYLTHLLAHTRTHTRTTQISPVVVLSRRGLYTAVKVFIAFRWTEQGNEGGREGAGSPLSQFEQRADEIKQVVVAGLTNEQPNGDENNKTPFACWNTDVYTCAWSYSRKGKTNLYFTLHYLLLSLSSVTHEPTGPLKS